MTAAGRRHRARYPTLLLVAATLLVACSSDSPERAQPGPPGIPRDRFAPFLADGAPRRILSIASDSTLATYDPGTGRTDVLTVNAACCGGDLATGKTTPQLSPDGKVVAYLDRDDNENLWVSDSTGRTRRKISSQARAGTDTTLGTTVAIAGWSDDHRYLVYHVSVGDEGPESGPARRATPDVPTGFHVADLRAGATVQVPTIAGRVQPEEFLPGTHTFVYAQALDQAFRRFDLYGYDVVAGSSRKLTVDPIETFGGQLSFRGGQARSFVFLKYLPGSPYAIVQSDIDGRNQRELASHRGIAQWPALSPDQRSVAYVTWAEGCPGPDCPNDMVVVDVASGRSRRVLGDVRQVLSWYDAERVVVLRGRQPPLTLHLVHVPSGRETLIAPNQALH